MKINNRSKRSKKPIFIIGMLLILLLAGGALAYYYASSRDKTAQTKDQMLEQKAGEKKSNDKDSNTPSAPAPATNSKDPATTNPSTPPSSNVSPFITYFGKSGAMLEVNAYVPGIIEDGTCTLTVKNGSGRITYTASKPARSSPQSTRCENFVFQDSGADNQWIASVSFKSTNYTGESQPTKFSN